VTRIEVRRSADWFRTREAGRDSRHLFSFGVHYDPARCGFGWLLAVNEERFDPGAGHAMHRHRDLEIVSWVLDGTLRHDDSSGRHEESGPGVVQRLTAGTGVDHAERAGPDGARFVQTWVVPERRGLDPSYERVDVGEALDPTSWVSLAGAAGPGARLHQPGAELRGARLDPPDSVRLPTARFVQVHVTRGEVDLAGVGPLAPGDSALLTQCEGRRLSAVTRSEVLCWVMTGDPLVAGLR